MKKILKTTGETLIEALISLTVLMVSGTAAAVLIISSLQTTALSKNYLVAQNLIIEAIEGLRNIRDTNWLTYPAYKDDCWLVISENVLSNTPNDCSGSSLQGNTNYRLLKSDIGRFYLEYSGNDNDYGLYLEDHDADGDTIPDYFTYEHPDPAAAPPTDEPAFYRDIDIDTVAADQIIFTVTIRWFEGAKEINFESEPITLTNYL